MISKRSDDCKTCGGISTIISDFTSGNIVCKKCGTIFEERAIDETNENRNFSNEQSMQGGKETSRLGGVINSNLGAIHLCIFCKKEKLIHFHELRSSW